jgi:hypothetical protein
MSKQEINDFLLKKNDFSFKSGKILSIHHPFAFSINDLDKNDIAALPD